MKRMCLALIGATALSGSAAAADLPAAPAPYYKAPAFAPAYSWTGLYAGINGGGGIGHSTWSSTTGFSPSGGQVGGTLGYNYQFGQGVIGIEGDLDWSGLSGSTSVGCPGGCTTKDSWMSTVRGRLGYAADRVMPYLTGGVAFGDIEASTSGFPGASDTRAGWTIGAGIEFAFAGNWTAKAEYLYVDLGNLNCGLNCGVTSSNNVSLSANLIRAGVNYRF